MTEKFDHLAKIRDKNIKFRKWKVKDKNKFLSANRDPKIIKEALVYDCLRDEKIALSEDEYKYLLMRIRAESLPNSISYTFRCDECLEEYDYTADLKQIMKPEFSKYGIVQSGIHSFEMTSIRNREFYDNVIGAYVNDEQKLLVDFILHIKSYNQNESLDFDGLNDIINNLDVDAFEDIFAQWEAMRFKVNNIHTVQCPHCKAQETYEFDDLPGFFPESWNI